MDALFNGLSSNEATYAPLSSAPAHGPPAAKAKAGLAGPPPPVRVVGGATMVSLFSTCFAIHHVPAPTATATTPTTSSMMASSLPMPNVPLLHITLTHEIHYNVEIVARLRGPDAGGAGTGGHCCECSKPSRLVDACSAADSREKCAYDGTALPPARDT